MPQNRTDILQAGEQAILYENFLFVFNRLILASRETFGKDEFLRKAVHTIGEHIQADRCYIIENPAVQRTSGTSQRHYEWSTSAHTSAERSHLHASEAWEEALGKNPWSAGLVRDLSSGPMREFLNARQVKAFLLAPIHVEGRFWGFIGLDDCVVERVWNEEYLQFAEAAAELIAQKLERGHLQQRLHQRENQLEVAIESSHDGQWHIDLEKNELILSHEWKKMLGYEDHEVEGSFQAFEQLIHPDDRKTVLRVLDPYANLFGGLVECEYRLKNKQGHYQWILTQAFVKRGESGQPQRFVGTNIDITARVNYKTHLEQKEEEYSSLVNSISEVIFRINGQGIFTFLNPAWSRITGFSVSKTLDTEAISYIHPDEREQLVQRLFASPEEQSQLVNMEVRLINARGQIQWAELFANIAGSTSGRLQEISGTIIDIHQRKTAEMALRESEERFRLMSENMSDLVSLHAPNGTYFYLSPSVRELLGYESYELIDTSLYDLVHQDDRDTLRHQVHDPILKGTLSKGLCQLRMRNKFGQWVWFETVLQSIRKEGRIESLLAVTRDISDRKLAELEMQKALEKEKELSELKSRFISMASHEFRTPLASIKSSVELLEMYTEEVGQRLSRPFLKHSQKIIGQIDRLSNLMNDILLLGRTEANKMPFDPEETDVVAFCRDFVDQLYTTRPDGRTVEIHTHGEQRPAHLDPTLLGHILSNGVSNAFKYSEGRGNPELHIDFEPDLLHLRIIDHGIGIPQEEQNQLFQSFFRAENTMNIEGTGLGLVIMKQFTEMHHGEIDIQSQVGKGTSVELRFPYIPETT